MSGFVYKWKDRDVIGCAQGLRHGRWYMYIASTPDPILFDRVNYEYERPEDKVITETMSNGRKKSFTVFGYIYIYESYATEGIALDALYAVVKDAMPTWQQNRPGKNPQMVDEWDY